VTGRKLSTVSKNSKLSNSDNTDNHCWLCFAGGWQQCLSSALGGMAAFVPICTLPCGYTDPPVNSAKRL